MTREILFFAVAASILGTVFLVSLIELIFTIRRRRVHRHIQEQIKAIRAQYNNSINQLVLEDESKIESTEKELAQATSQVQEEKIALEKNYKEKIDSITQKSKKALEAAKARAKKLEEEAELKADEYLQSRQKEVEEELMNLVIAVTKKVLPAGISYEIQKELVIQALKDLKTGNEE